MGVVLWKTLCILPLLFVVTIGAQIGGRRKGGGGIVAETNYPGSWELFSPSSGVSAMHAILLPKINKVLMYDATIWRISAIKLPDGVPCHVVNAATNEIDCWAHSVLMDIETGGLRPLQLNTDTWCSSGGLTENGTLVSTGGFQGGANTARYLLDCDNCDWVEYPSALAAPRWYADGSFMVFGGRAAMNYEIIPPEGVVNTKIYDSPLLQQTTDKDENNLYPFVFLSTDGNIFLFANDRSILLNPNTHQVVHEFPVLIGGSRNYPASGLAALLPIKLHVQNGPVISADVLVCGGAKKTAFDLAAKNMFLNALDTCGRITITGKNPRWKVETMPSARILGDAMILPTGDVLMINGAKKGSAGWHYAQDPNFVPVLYSPDAPKTKRFKQLAPSTIPRMYHSSSALLPDGRVFIAGSNTNNGYIYNTEYPTELRVEKFSPPYFDPALAYLKPQIVEAESETGLKYGMQFKIRVKTTQTMAKEDLKATMYAPAFTTHGINMNQRLLVLGLVSVEKDAAAPGVFTINAVAPPSGVVAPPGYYLLYVVYHGVPGTAIALNDSQIF